MLDPNDSREDFIESLMKKYLEVLEQVNAIQCELEQWQKHQGNIGDVILRELYDWPNQKIELFFGDEQYKFSIQDGKLAVEVKETKTNN